MVGLPGPGPLTPQPSPPGQTSSAFASGTRRAGRSNNLAELDSDHLDSSSAGSDSVASGSEDESVHPALRKGGFKHKVSNENDEVMHDTGGMEGDDRRGGMQQDGDSSDDDDVMMAEEGTDDVQTTIAPTPFARSTPKSKEPRRQQVSSPSTQSSNRNLKSSAKARTPALSKLPRGYLKGDRILDQNYPGKLTYDPFLALLKPSTPGTDSAR